MSDADPVTIERISPSDALLRLDELAEVLHAAVCAGASIGFLSPFSVEESRAFFRTQVFPAMAGGARHLFVALDRGCVVGTVQLHAAAPANQPHHAQVMKLITHPAHRRRGVARALIRALEAWSLTLGRTLITLDTRTGDAAEPLYQSLGYTTVGQIPCFCRDTLTERWDPTTVMYKHLCDELRVTPGRPTRRRDPTADRHTLK